MSEMYIINVQLIEKKNIGKANKKTTDKNFLPPLCIKKKQAIFTKKRRERATQLFYQQHTHKDNNNNKNEKSDFK